MLLFLCFSSFLFSVLDGPGAGSKINDILSNLLIPIEPLYSCLTEIEAVALFLDVTSLEIVDLPLVVVSSCFPMLL